MPIRLPALRAVVTVALVGLVIAAVATTNLRAQQTGAETASIRGVVVDGATGQPLVGAYVGIAGRMTRVFTDDDGRFALDDLPAGPADLLVQQLGYEEFRETRTLEAGLTADLRIALVADPLILPRIEVYADRLKARRNALATSVRVFDARQLVASPAVNAMEFVQGRALTPVRCPGYLLATGCILRRGQVVAPRIFVDDVPYPPGLETLQLFDTFDVWFLEVLSSGAQVRLYTKAFAERLALGRERMFPVIF